ncbi:type II toxin-antitoxin system HipA family toxin YjjJ [Chitinimonas arctica]|uniref:type II toxin-antitoxin system HipA family toxin YjjJ n=1 Tax=Chitinimonas arctica TaxID=2594795 RepID=UPI0021E022D7|nr:type II toxin-antitoxin system HipA family toxin YjjJ [Chitinimonas arctica]
MVQADGVTLHGDGLPWWLFDMRPQGYLGRAYASTYAAGFGLPANPEHWSDTEVIRALLVHGHDAIGNLLIGELARDRFIGMPAPSPVDRAADYPALARVAGFGEVPGSSAGGEQPKFCVFTERGHVLVKFSAPDDNPVSERWRDLLLAEHLALSVLGVKTEVFDFGGQRFLEVPRFDRVGQLGRVGVCSLRALDAEFVGSASAPWPSLVSRLAADGHVHADAVTGAALLWAFGTLIGNTDMHAGNLSFISCHGRPYQLAPAYDVLPMGFAPRSGGAVVDTLPPASLPASVDGETWRKALHLAEMFFTMVRDCDSFSGSFSPCIEAIRRHIDEAAFRIARLG